VSAGGVPVYALVAKRHCSGRFVVLTRRGGSLQVVSKIESVKVNKLDKPYDDVKILSAEAT
jgi:hypothetical protein